MTIHGLVYKDVIRNMLAYTEGGARQVHDIRKPYAPNEGADKNEEVLQTKEREAKAAYDAKMARDPRIRSVVLNVLVTCRGLARIPD
jgi:hypothetical protein